MPKDYWAEFYNSYIFVSSQLYRISGFEDIQLTLFHVSFDTFDKFDM